MQTSVIRPEPDSVLRLESPTRSVAVDAAQDIELLSQAGDILATSLLDTRIVSEKADIKFDAANVFMENLAAGSANGQAQHQVCICANGRLFLATANTDCRADGHICA